MVLACARVVSVGHIDKLAADSNLTKTPNAENGTMLEALQADKCHPVIVLGAWAFQRKESVHLMR